MRKERSKVEFVARTSKKTDSAKWKERRINPLTHLQDRIRKICEAFLAGEITPEEFRGELPPIPDAGDQEKRERPLTPNASQ